MVDSVYLPANPFNDCRSYAQVVGKREEVEDGRRKPDSLSLNPSEDRIGKSSDVVGECIGEEQEKKTSIGNKATDDSCGEVKEVCNSISRNYDQAKPCFYEPSCTD